MYTSGWPKNQNRCWNRIGSPPPAGSKKVVLILRSVKSIVIPPASTGIDSSSRTAVRPMAQTIRFTLSAPSLDPLRHNGDAIKLIDAIKLLIPPICNAPIARSTLVPGCPEAERGG